MIVELKLTITVESDNPLTAIIPTAHATIRKQVLDKITDQIGPGSNTLLQIAGLRMSLNSIALVPEVDASRDRTAPYGLPEAGK